MSRQKKSKIFKTFLVTSIVFTNFSFFNTLNRTTNYRIDKHFELTGNDKNNQPNISESIFDFA